jgi:hypothetical protein
MRVEKIAGPPNCDDGDCPTVYLSDRGTLVVQGDHVASADGMHLGEGEQAVEIPFEVLLGAARALEH